MGEIKSVKVDNWGVFFLQKLQNFFNKTDYCDLTLQFRDNSQLKVHRLVLSACTDYFNVLEQTCEVIDDAIIMPNGLQADVVVPIVNFMYTGTLEFELKMYNRLLRTAKDMNMTVLLKLLEAHRRTMEMHPQKGTGQASPKTRRKIQAGAVTGNVPNSAGGRSSIQTNQGNKRIVVGSSVNTQQNRTVANSNAANRPLPVRQIGSTTFTRIKVENDQQETHAAVSSSGGYSLIKQSSQLLPQQPTSPFEQLRKGYNNNKRPAVTSFVSPPAKKPNLEDVKEFAEQQRMRKQIAAEYGDDDYDASNIMDDDTIHNDDDDDDMMTSSGHTQTHQTTGLSTSAAVQTVASSSTQQTQSEDPPGTTTIIVKHEGPDKPPTIVVKDVANSKMNHAKIISEVLRQYPHLVKSNKNIKLKIMPNAGGHTQKVIVKKEVIETENQMHPPTSKPSITSKITDQQSSKTLVSNIVSNRAKSILQQQVEVPSAKTIASGLQATVSKPIVASSTTSTQSSEGQPQKRRIDSKTMHALIALGAENTKGPWLCLRCGRNGHPISIPSYRGFRRHLINTHKEVIDPALCEHCGWRSTGKRELHFHMLLEHKIRNNLYIFPECQLCQRMCIDSNGLNQHLIDFHPDENKQQCIYCNKIFPEELQLYTHMKTFHKKQALEDGIIDYSDDENQTQLTLPPLPSTEYDQEVEQDRKDDQQEKKIKILSDISLPIASSIVKTDTFAQETSAANEEYLQDQEHEEENTETKFVAADGSEVILTPQQRKEILSQLNQEHEGSGVVMVLNEDIQQPYSEIQSDQGAISQDETSQATTATNEEREEEEEHVTEENEQHDDNQIYNEIKSLHSNLEDSTTQSEAEGKQETLLHEEEPDHEPENVEAGMGHDERSEHFEESKESIDNLEWAENLISEHDLADDVSSQTGKETKQAETAQIKDDDNKSQDEISKKLKELTGDWSDDDDDDEDMPERKTSTEVAPVKDAELVTQACAAEDAELEEKEETETEKLSKEQGGNPEFEDHAELLASLQSTSKEEELNENVKLDTDANECDNIDEDDIDIALKSLHKEDEEYVTTNKTKEDEVQNNEATKDTISLEKEIVKAENEKETTSNDETKKIEADEEKPEEKLVKELETINEPGPNSSAMEVDGEIKKDLIESLLSEEAETMENTATETPALAAETIKSETDKDDANIISSPGDELVKQESAEPVNDKENPDESKTLISNDEEFLNITPENIVTSSDIVDLPTNVTATSTSDIGVTETADVAAASSTKEENTVSSEDRVKSLISEWGDDDEDDYDNDADLTANL